jgi:hypothetical protein
MNETSMFIEPYKPSSIHAIYRWVDQLPGPYWLYSIAILVLTGLLNLIVAWKANVLRFGEINWYYATTGFFVAYVFFANDFLFRVAKSSVSEFLTILDADENKCRLILFEFTHLPARPTAVLFILGALIGFFLGAYLFPTAPEMNHAFPELELTMYSLTMGLLFIGLYAILRASGLISRLFEERVHIDIFDQASLYAISRYSACLVMVFAIPTYLQSILIPSFVKLTATYLTQITIYWLVILIVFWLPLRGANRILVLEKRRLLKYVNHRIRANFELLHSKTDNHEYQNTADIRQMIESLRIEQETIKSIGTLPWRTGTLTGLLSAVLLPVLTSSLIDILNKFIK